MKPLLARIKDRCTGTEDGCWIWQQACDSNGYPVMGLAALAGQAPLYVRRLVYVIAVGELTAKRRVTSTCEDKKCCAPEHLVAMTEGQLARTERRKLTQSRGVSHALAIQKIFRAHQVIPLKDVQHIRARVMGGETQRKIAAEYGVSPSAISALWRGKSFKPVHRWAA